MRPRQEENIEIQEDEEVPDSPESLDESMSSDVFIVEEATNNEESITSTKAAEYLEQVRQEDSSSYFITGHSKDNQLRVGEPPERS